MALEKKVAASANMVEAIKSAAEIFAGDTAQIFDSGGELLEGVRTYKQLYTDIRSVAASLVGRDFPEGGRAAVFSKTRPEWNIVDIAVLAAGGATVGVYHNDSDDNIEHVLLNSKASVLFVDTEARLNRILNFPPNMLPDLKLIVHFEKPGLPADDSRVVDFESFLETRGDESELYSRIASITPDTLARVVYTSGTVGRPKGAMLTHDNLLSNVVTCSELLKSGRGDTCMAYLPTAHIFQALLANKSLLNGTALAYSEWSSLIESMKKARPTILPGVPRVFTELLEKAAVLAGKETEYALPIIRELDPETARSLSRDLGIDNVRLCISGAAKLDPVVAEAFEEKFGIRILEGYGLSETAPVIAVNTPGCCKTGTVGKPIPGTEVKILDEEGRETMPGKLGEIAVKGPGVFNGYLERPELNSDIFSPGGFFYTGDLGLLDHDGFLQVHGRKGNQVKFANGEYYDLEELGDKFMKHTTLIQQIAVAGEQKDYPVGVISLSEELDLVVRYADSLGIPYDKTYDLVYNDLVIEAVRKEFFIIMKEQESLPLMERIRKVLYVRPFSSLNKEATATGKVRVKKILFKYRDEIEKLYDDTEEFRVLRVSRYEK